MLLKRHLFKIVLILSLATTNNIYAQHAEDIIGNWKVIKAELSDQAKQEEKKMLPRLNAIFSKTTFHFKADSSFLLKSPEKVLNQPGMWLYNEEEKRIIVWEKNPKGRPGKLMEILVKVIDGQYKFEMIESPVILTVSRITVTQSK